MKYTNEVESQSIILVPFDLTKNNEENRLTREHHNANHALWFLSMIIYSLQPSKLHVNIKPKTDRVVAHLTHLQEVLHSTAVEHREIVTDLLNEMHVEYPAIQAHWVNFIYTHWDLLQQFADYYGQKEKCFPQESHQKIAALMGVYQNSLDWESKATA
ncbi:MAG: hypothetical protein EXS63_05430 [Candidatus Omnitrophica bacterium]|nr:hypothetical protein [Candidatus Omnitrophota bacterium]